MRRLLILAAAVSLAACSNDNDGPAPVTEAPTPPPVTTPPPTPAVFEVVTINLTAGQPLSPIAVSVHDNSRSAFAVGEPASMGLELLAEGGDNSELLTELAGVADASGDAPVGPGGTETLTVELPDDQTAGLDLSVMTMLVNTNDAIVGVNGADVSGMAVGDSRVFNAIAYDAGTEANSEAAGTMPGPADGGEGFNADRDDIADQVTMHPGVITADDGLASSVLNQSHRWDNPAIRVRITRTQ